MKRFIRGMAIGGLTLLAAGSAGAATTLYTPPANAAFAGEIIGCRVTNVSTTPRTVEIELRDYAGALVTSTTVMVPARATDGTGDMVVGSYCKFTVLNGTSTNVRGAAVYMTNAGVVTTVVPAQ
jgi:hypothetical protein